MIQITSSNPLEPFHPTFQAIVEIVNVLNKINSFLNTLLLAFIDQHPLQFGKLLIIRCCISAWQSGRVNKLTYHSSISSALTRPVPVFRAIILPFLSCAATTAIVKLEIPLFLSFSPHFLAFLCDFTLP